ncbi:hypothetical protein pclt_cds_633 [Pandoravirus celtis]|uniref:DUF5867 domain-containing protein n=1 Tax=Pandoravirus celtis TaxID=2568002 RepID=A0A4D6EHF1_9VIRU|nr:hypothetical protein pclt_cds_633 [Pandoravirus celtis]
MYHGKGSQSSLFAKDGRGSMGLIETPEGPAAGLTTQLVTAARRLDSNDPAQEAATDVDAVHAVPFLPTTATTTTAPSVLDDALGHIEQGAKAWENVIFSATFESGHREAHGMPITALDAPCTARPLKPALVDAMLSKGDAAIDRCMAVVSRIESLVHLCAATATTEDAFAGEMLGRVTTWLFDVVRGEAKPARADDPWMPMADVAYAAGRMCSAPLIECVRLAVERRPAAQIDTIEAPRPTKSMSKKPWYRAAQMARIIESFVSGLIDADQTQYSRERTKACRSPALALVRVLRPMVDRRRGAAIEARIDRVRAVLIGAIDPLHTVLTVAIDQPRRCRRDTLAYMLALLTTINLCYINADNAATQKVIEMLDFIDPTRSAALAGLDITGADIVNDSDDNSDGDDDGDDGGNPEPPRHQDDLLTAVSTHHPDLFLAILAHVDAWGIGSLALTSRSHYARIINAIEEDDTRADLRRLNGVALSGTVWLQRHGYAHAYDPTPKVITPTLDRGILPGLGPLLLLCRSMPTVETMDPAKWGCPLLATLAKACVLDCGGAIARCLDRLGFNLQPDGRRRLRYPVPLVASLAFWAGSCVSPTLMRIACTASLLWMRQSHRRAPRPLSHIQRVQIQLLVEKAVSGIKHWLALSRHAPHRRRFSDLPSLVEFLCKFLRAVRPDIGECGRRNERSVAGLRTIFRRAGMALLAPGHRRPMPVQRAALALALFDAVRLPPSDYPSTWRHLFAN